MTENNRTQTLLDATGGIREEYIEEAAAYRRSRPVWAAFAAVAAVLAILIGVAVQRQPETPKIDPIAFFAIRAYAVDGTVATLEKAGDSSDLTAGESDLFPGKKVYTLDISLSNADGSGVDLSNYRFECYHRGNYLEPGESDEYISITWLEEDDFYGYRITGWCEEVEYVDITIRDHSGMIMYQKSMFIKLAEEYSVDVYTAYSYEKDLSTQALIEKLFDTGQRYYINTMAVSTAGERYEILVSQCGGFAELEQRKDAASLLLQRWVLEMEERKNPVSSLDCSGMYGLLLAQDAHWNNLTEEELAVVESYDLDRFSETMRDPSVHWERATYAIYMMDDYKPEYNLLVEYEDRAQQKSDYLFVSRCNVGLGAESRTIGWTIRIDVEEPTVLRFTVVDGEDNIIRQERIVITPTENGYLLVTELNT